MRFVLSLFMLAMTFVSSASFAASLQMTNGISTTGYIEGVSASGAWIATQAEAEAGVDDTQVMTPLKTKYAIDAQAAANPGNGASASYVSFGKEETNSPSATFSGLSFGAAATDRYMLAVISGALVNGGRNLVVSSVSIGGVTATKLYDIQASHRGVSFWLAKVPTGTSGNVVMNITENTNYKAVALYRITGLNEGFRSSGDGSLGGTTQTLSLNLPRNALAFYGAVCGLMGTAGTTSWSGATKNLDTQTGGTNNIHTTASVAATSLMLNYPVTQTWSVSCGYPTLGGVVLY